MIKDLRERSEQSLADVAGELGWDKGRLSRYENDQRALSLPVIEELAPVLGETPEAIVLACLKHRYPRLARPNSKVGRAVEGLIRYVSKNSD